MTMGAFATAYDALSPADQALFAATIHRLLTDGLLWREDERDRRAYAFLTRHRELVQDYLDVAGWELRHDERTTVFHVMHREGANRRRFSLDVTIWLLLLRLIYAEQRESLTPILTRFPVVSVGDVIRRYASFFEGQTIRKKTSLDEALRTLTTAKLIRGAGGSVLRAGHPDQMIELLPTLEVIVPAAAIAQLADRLREYADAPEGSKADVETDSDMDG